jgi:hypothetical protein
LTSNVGFRPSKSLATIPTLSTSGAAVISCKGDPVIGSDKPFFNLNFCNLQHPGLRTYYESIYVV